MRTVLLLVGWGGLGGRGFSGTPRRWRQASIITMDVGDGGATAPSQRDTKYDRQLRLWGANGQKALMTARILLLNAGPTGTEILKNLVLPGVGHFVVIDGNPVTRRDLNNNFFVDEASLGQPRSKVVTSLLMEMNPDVKGEYRAVSPEVVIRGEPDYLLSFTLVIATQMEEGTLRDLAQVLWASRTPLLIARSYGLIGYLRLVVPELHIIDSRAEEEKKSYYNLCVADPLPQVQALADALDFTAMDSSSQNRVPYLLILLKAKTLWAKQHPGKRLGFSTKASFLDTIKSLSAHYDQQDNFLEALNYAHLAYATYEIPPEVHDLLGDPCVQNLHPASSHFWVLVKALQGFLEEEGHGRLPLSGAIPDMASSTDSFTELQNLYRAKASVDFHAMKNRVHGILQSLGRPVDSISDSEVETFCKNSFSIRLVRSRPLDDELTQLKSETIHEAMDDFMEGPTDMCPMMWYLGLRAVDRFHQKRGRYPGLLNDELGQDEEMLWEELQSLWSEVSGNDAMEDASPPPIKRELAMEMARYGAAEIHNIAAVVGGIGSQEAVKVITKQYVPLSNTYIYNGISSVGAMYDL